jgi:anti-sigma factor RsiW
VERLIGHTELQELLGAYALDAVDPDEAAAIERHLPTCPRCRNELAEHREVAALLGYAGGSAPSGVWDRIVASLEEPPPALLLTRMIGPPDPGAPPFPGTPASDTAADLAAPRPNPWDRPLAEADHQSLPGEGESPGLASGPQMPPPIHARPANLAPATAAENNPIPINRPRRRRTVETRILVALATAAAVIVAALGIEVGRLQARKPATQTASLAAQAYHLADADTTARHLTLTSQDGVHTVRAVIIADGTTYLGPGNLAQLPPDETYQMWGIVNGALVSLGVIGDNPTYHVFTTPTVANVLAMTVEPKGGVVTSTKTPVVTAVVPG